jgi:CBS domain-containing protein
VFSWLFKCKPKQHPRLHVLPVVDVHHGNLVGVISAKDVMRDVMKTANKALPSEEDFSKRTVPNLEA